MSEIVNILDFNEWHYEENAFQFHFNMKYMALKFEQNKIEKTLRLMEMRHMHLGNEYGMFYRALELNLPWFTVDFTSF